MSLITWITQLTDDYLIHWANRGLLRRATKLAAQLEPSAWHIGDDKCEANIDDCQLSLTIPDINKIACSCGELDACVHRLSFLLVLRDHVLKGNADKGNDEGSTTEDGKESQTGDSDRQQDQATQQDQPLQINNDYPIQSNAFSLDVWLVDSLEQLEDSFTSKTIETALSYALKGGEADIVIHDDHAIVACQLHYIKTSEKYFEVYLPSHKNWNLSQCTCKKTACVHRAFCVIFLSIREKKLTIAADAINEVISQEQILQLNNLQLWLNRLFRDGLNNLLADTLVQGKIISTELTQVDLPKMSRLLNALIGHLNDLLERIIYIDYEKILELCTVLQRDIKALQQKPLALPHALLLGEHKRKYKKLDKMKLIGVHVEHWKTRQGTRGYSFYFYNAETGAWYAFTEGRKGDFDRDWRSESAINNTTFGKYSSKKLLLHENEMTLYQSIDGSLTTQNMQTSSYLSPVDWQVFITNPLLNITMQHRLIAERQFTPFYSPQTDNLGWLLTTDTLNASNNEFTVTSQCGETIHVVKHHNFKASSNHDALKLFFGRWHLKLDVCYFEAMAEINLWN